MSKALSFQVPVLDENGEAVHSDTAKKMRRLTVKKFLKNVGVRVQYVRTLQYSQYHNLYDNEGNCTDRVETLSKGDPYGVVVSQIIDGRLYLGWSLLHKKDVGKYDRDIGIINAVSRLVPFESYLNNVQVPDEIRKTMARIMARNILYFKGKK